MRNPWLPFLSALLFWASFHPLDLGILGFVALVPLMRFAKENGGRRAFFTAWAAGWAAFAACFFWVRHTVPAGPWLLAVYMGLYFPLFATAVRRLGAAWAPAAWVALEYARGHLFSGLPWFALGTTQHGSLLLMQTADLGGVWLVSGIVALANAALADGRRGLRWTAAGALALGLVYGAIRLPTIPLEDGPRLAVVQPNIPQDIKYVSIRDPEQAVSNYEKHLALNRQAGEARPDLILWPEAAIYRGLVWDGRRDAWIEDAWYERVLAPADETGVPVLLGLLVADRRPDRWEYTNSAVLVRPGEGIVERFDKVHLVPFAEYVPLAGAIPAIRDLITRWSGLQLADMRPGAGFPLWEAGGVAFGPQICFEAIFPEISREIARNGARFTVNISNDGWFRDSAELDQMQVMSRFRSVESRISVVRATNTGISSFIEPTGRVQAVLEAGGKVKEVEGVLEGRIRVTSAGSLYRSWGDWVAWLAAGAAMGEIVRRIFVDRKRGSA
jgi:apolipoprotein N-acyltransferase